MTRYHRVSHSTTKQLLLHTQQPKCCLYMDTISCVQLCVELINGDDLTLGFIRVNDLNCLECVALNGGKEFLLCFHSKSLFHLMHI